MLLSIIVVSYNTKNLTLQTLESVKNTIEESSLLKNQTEIFVVDNYSHDDSVSAIQDFIGKTKIPTHLIQNGDNLGFAKANNEAIVRSEGTYILLLNSDTVVQPHALDEMVTAFEKVPVNEIASLMESQRGKLDKLGILAATLINPDGTTQPQGGSFPTLFSLGMHMFMIDDLPFISRFLPSTQHTGKNAFKNVDQKDWVGGTAMMVRRILFDEVGLLDPNIFMYGEDLEFCMRARNHHWDVAILPGARVTHFGSASSSQENAIRGEFSAYVYIWSKHKPLWQMPFLKAFLWWGAVLRMLLFGTICHNREKAKAYRTIIRTVLH